MAFFTTSIMADVVIHLAILLLAVIFYFKYKFSYWTNLNVPTLNPTFPFGNAGASVLHQESQAETLNRVYKDLKKKGKRFGGIYYFVKPIFVPVDVTLIKDMLTTSFHHFHDRGFHFDEETDPLTANLVVLPGERWKRLRAKLSPAFSSGKMKQMFHILTTCGEELRKVTDISVSSGDPINIQDILERFTADVIGSCGFGMDTNCLRDPNAEFLKFTQIVAKPSLKDWIKIIFSYSASGLLKLLRIRVSNNEVLEFFQNIVDEAIEYREKNNVTRKDYMDLLIQLKNKGTIQDETDSKSADAGDNIKWTNSEIVAQAFMFFIAGYETSSTTMTSVLYELVMHTDIQDKVRMEIFSVLKRFNGQLTYECLAEMQYLEKVINETLRLHPPIPLLVRECTKAYRIPNTDITIEKGVITHIPMWGLQKDPEFFPNPDIFDPERFNDENKAARPSTAYLAFGEGPRSCIGTRFGYMQSKIGLIVLLKAFKFKLSSKTELPIRVDPKTLHNHFLQTVWLDAVRVNT